MAELALFERRLRLVEALGALPRASTIADIIALLARTARQISGADGICVIRRENDMVSYVAEDAEAPLWQGRSFPIDRCISGLALREDRVLLIPDVYVDARVPHAAYRPTFVRSMAMFPVASHGAALALGAYWRVRGPIDPVATTMLQRLSECAARSSERILAATTGLATLAPVEKLSA
jgi:hypothetical protein